MPAKNAIKIYAENTFYHIFNRGVDKRLIFLDDFDYVYFLHLLKKYFAVKIELLDKELGSYKVINNPNCMSDRVSLLCFCLMPNHFHLLVQQLNNRSIDELMRKICTSYSIYFNKKYKRQGTLFQGRYKAVIISGESQLIYITKYIHLNPKEKLLNNISNLKKYKWSSYSCYLGLTNLEWLDKSKVLELFSKNTNQLSYQYFIENDFMLTNRLYTYVGDEILLDRQL